MNGMLKRLLSPRVGQGTNKAWPGLTGGFFHEVVGEMLAQGFTPDDIGKVGGGNFCRVFGKATAATPSRHRRRLCFAIPL